MRLQSLLCAAALALLTVPGHTAVVAGAGVTDRFVLAPTTVDGIAITEVSGLAWDTDEQLLYAVSDQGYVYHFRIQLAGDTIASIQPVSAAALTAATPGRADLDSRKRFNAEGLAVRRGANGTRGDSELIIALEANPPQIARFNPTGALLDTLPVPAPANNVAHYATSKKGKIKHGLEALALHAVFGLATAPESPLSGHPANLHTVYANGHAWSFPRHAPESRLKGVEVLPDGSLLVLERSRPTDSKATQVASLRRVDIAACKAAGVCKTTLLATLPPSPSNFEGMTLVDAHHALLASDNSGDPARGTVFQLIVLP